MPQFWRRPRTDRYTANRAFLSEDARVPERLLREIRASENIERNVVTVSSGFGFDLCISCHSFPFLTHDHYHLIVTSLHPNRVHDFDPVSELFKIRHPILLAGMCSCVEFDRSRVKWGRVGYLYRYRYGFAFLGMNVASGPELAVTVTNYGGSGVIGGHGYTPKVLRQQVRPTTAPQTHRKRRSLTAFHF